MRTLKKLLTLTIFLFAISSFVQAQLWFDVGVKGMWGATSALNKNINDESGYTYRIPTGHGIGGKVGLNFGANNGISFEALASKSRAEYDYKQGNNTLENNIEWKSTDLYALYRYQGQGAYFEIGPKYSIVNEVNQMDGNLELNDIQDAYDNYFSGVLGFGSYLAGTGSLQVVLGVRISYSFQDFVTEEGFAQKFPTPNYAAFSNQEKTTPVAVQLSLEVNYVLGYVGKQHCYDRWRLMSFD